jgi:GDPmannose 4,6-dehydratase
MWRMLRADSPDDYVIATGETHSVREFLDQAAALLDLDWESFVELDPRYLRPTEVDVLRGDASKAAKQLGWSAGTSFEELVRIMVDADCKLLEDELHGRAVRRTVSGWSVG